MGRKTGQTPLVLAVIALTAACSGDQGPTGPAGPEGPEGPEGVQGPPGTANIISGRVTLTEADWSASTIFYSFETTPNSAFFWEDARYTDVSVPEISAGVVEDGAVLMWLTTAFDLSEFLPIPIRFSRNTTTAYTWSYYARISEENIRLLFLHERLDPAVSPPDPLATTQPDRILRWVIIPPAAAAAAETLPVHLGADATVRALAEQGFRLSHP